MVANWHFALVTQRTPKQRVFEVLSVFVPPHPLSCIRIDRLRLDLSSQGRDQSIDRNVDTPKSATFCSSSSLCTGNDLRLLVCDT